MNLEDMLNEFANFAVLIPFISLFIVIIYLNEFFDSVKSKVKINDRSEKILKITFISLGLLIPIVWLPIGLSSLSFFSSSFSI